MIYFACILTTSSRLRLLSGKMHFNIKKAVIFWAFSEIFESFEKYLNLGNSPKKTKNSLVGYGGNDGIYK